MDDIVKKAEEYLLHAELKRGAHFLGARISFKHHRTLGIIAICMNAVIATAFFTSLNNKVELLAAKHDVISLILLLLVTLLSVAAVVFSSLLTFLAYDERSEKNRVAAGGYQRLKHRLDLFLLKYRAAPPDAREAALRDFEAIVEEFDETTRNSPPIADSLYEEAKKGLPAARS